MIGHYSFYATSHQATLSQIEWHAAFVGRTAMHDHNNTISAILILINTFGGQFLIFCLYPLLVMTPTALYTIFPSLAPRRTTKIVIQNQNGTKQREILKKIVDRFEHSSVNVTKYNGLDAENDDMDVPRGELTLYENEDIFIGSVFKAGCQLLILQGIRVSFDVDPIDLLSHHCRQLHWFLSFSDIWRYAGLHHSLSTFDGVENIRATLHLRGHCHVPYIRCHFNWFPHCYSRAQGCKSAHDSNERFNFMNSVISK